ncbi:MAG: hypothetical protein HQK74_06675 [Desulfamplus sp.]|nr:hypothetical protein [Desulfamplus sp.]
MLLSIILNILFFLLGGASVWFYLRHSKQQKIYEAISKSAIIRKQVESFTSRIGEDTENAIINFAELLQNLNTSIQATTGVVSEIQSRMALTADKSQSSNNQKQQHDLNLIKTRYQLMLNEVMEQLNLTIQRKTEDIAKLDYIRDGVNMMKPFSKEIGDIAFSTKIIALNATIEAARVGKRGDPFGVIAAEVHKLANKSSETASIIESDMNRLISYIGNSIDEIENAMDVETKFINSTITLLQDIVLSVVSSFVKLSEVIKVTLGDSSKFRDDINGIVINLQFEDICKQMSQNTIKLINSIQDDLKQVNPASNPFSPSNIAKLKKKKDDKKDKQDETAHKILQTAGEHFTMASEVKNAREALNLGDESDKDGSKKQKESEEGAILFFDDDPVPPSIPETTTPADNGDDVLFFDDEPSESEPPTDNNEDDVLFFDDEPSEPEPSTNNNLSDDVVFFDDEPSKEEQPPTQPSEDKTKSKKDVEFKDDDVTFF